MELIPYLGMGGGDEMHARKSQRMHTTWETSFIWEDNIKMNLKETGYEDGGLDSADWIQGPVVVFCEHNTVLCYPEASWTLHCELWVILHKNTN